MVSNLNFVLGYSSTFNLSNWLFLLLIFPKKLYFDNNGRNFSFPYLEKLLIKHTCNSLSFIWACKIPIYLFFILSGMSLSSTYLKIDNGYTLFCLSTPIFEIGYVLVIQYVKINPPKQNESLAYTTYYNKERMICTRTQNAFLDYPETHFHYLRYCLISKAARLPNWQGIPSLPHRH